MNPFEGLKHLIKSKAEHDREFFKAFKIFEVIINILILFSSTQFFWEDFSLPRSN